MSPSGTTTSTTNVTKKNAIITLAQLGKHEDVQNLWVAVHGKVYDLTTFASDHPGGIDVLTDTAGTDATESFEYAGHTSDAIATMAKFQVGRLEGSEVEEVAPPPKASSLPSSPPPGKRTESTAGGWIRPVILPLLALAAGSVIPVLIREGPRLIAALPPFTLPTFWAAGQEADGTSAFLLGLFLAGSAGFFSLAYIYWRFNRTLEHEKSVFLYPAVIPKGTTSLMICE